jgi:hypothetical protein
MAVDGKKRVGENGEESDKERRKGSENGRPEEKYQRI